MDIEDLKLSISALEETVKAQQSTLDTHKKLIDAFTRNMKKAKKTSGPKKPKSAYMFFFMDESTKTDIKSTTPDITPKEMTIEMGRRWRILTEYKKTDKNKYELEYNTWKETVDQEDSKTTEKRQSSNEKVMQKFIDLASGDKTRYEQEVGTVAEN